MRTTTGSRRTILTWTAVVLVVLLAAAYLVAVSRGRQSFGADAAGAGTARIMVVDQSAGASDVVMLGDGADPSRSPTGLRCQRVYAAGGTTSCMKLAGLGPTYELSITDASGRELRTIPLAGIPSRTRVSASGQIVSWTVFVTGDSYAAPGGFSTRTGFLDLRTGRAVDSLETFAAAVDGRTHSAVDTNYWGMTVGADDRTFYATMASGSKHWLVRGDLDASSMTTVREGAECPSLSPDGTRVAYKKRTGRLGAWQLAVLDLARGVETLLPGTQGVDDQAAWLDDATLLYGLPSTSGQPPAVYRVASDGAGEPVLVATAASSPVPIG